MASFAASLMSNDNENESCFPSLNFKQRMIGFCVCVGLGYFIQMLAFGSFISMLAGSPEKFAMFYTIGNIISIIGTGFLIGFAKQIERMADKDRRITSLVFIGAMIMTLVSAYLFQSALLVIIFLIIQICAYIWYVASYIWGGQTCIANCINGTVGKNIIPK